MIVSRVGKKEIAIPAGAEITFSNSVVNVKGSKGQLQQPITGDIDITINKELVEITARNDAKETRALHGLYRQLLANMLQGVTTGFQKKLVLKGIGYRAEISGEIITFSLGYSTQISYRIPESITIEYDKKDTVTISGFDKQLVGQVAAEIRSLRPPEPYKGKGIRYADEVIRLKAGKAGVK